MSFDPTEDVAAVRAALRAQLGGERRKQTTAKGRKKSERASLVRPDDGRLSHRGSVAQLNVNVEEHWKAWLARAKHDHNMAIFEIVERGLELVKAELERSHA
jgi:hypothetical protein